MLQAQLYFLSDQYYQDFPDDKLMKNKDTIDGVPHSRPCFFAFPDSKNSEIYWVVPISSKFEKYKRIEQDKIRKYGRCNTICFGTVLGRNTAFLIQNMCPAIEKYLVPYIDKNRQPIRIDDRVTADIKKNAREVLAIARRGAKVIFPDIFQIYRGLEEQLRQAQRDRLPPSSAQEKTSILEQLHQLEQAQPSGNRKRVQSGKIKNGKPNYSLVWTYIAKKAEFPHMQNYSRISVATTKIPFYGNLIVSIPKQRISEAKPSL